MESYNGDWWRENWVENNIDFHSGWFGRVSSTRCDEQAILNSCSHGINYSTAGKLRKPWHQGNEQACSEDFYSKKNIFNLFDTVHHKSNRVTSFQTNTWSHDGRIIVFRRSTLCKRRTGPMDRPSNQEREEELFLHAKSHRKSPLLSCHNNASPLTTPHHTTPLHRTRTT